MANFLDALMSGVRKVVDGNAGDVELPIREAIAFKGAGVTVTDNASKDAIEVEIQAGVGGASDAIDVAYDNTVSGLVATDVQAAIDELAQGGGGDVAAPSFVFRPGGVAGGNVYTDETSLLAALPESGFVDVLIDGSNADVHPDFGVPVVVLSQMRKSPHRDREDRRIVIARIAAS